MTIELRTLRVSAEMDASKYTTAATQINAANASMIASGKSVAVVMSDTGTKVSSAGDPVARLSRQFVDGFGASQKFEAGLRSLNRMLEQGKIDASQAATIYSGMTTKLGLVANGTSIAAQGYGKLGTVVDTVNARLGAQVVAANSATASLTRLNAAANQNALRGAGSFNTGNIAAQFQDIAVTSAMGMSPLQIALQQGTQLSAVLGPMGAAGAARSLGAALLAVVSPMSLITLGVVGLSAAAIQYFGRLMTDSADSAEALQKQADLIDSVASQWGNALPALKVYNDELTRQKDLADALAASQAAVSQQYAPLRQRVESSDLIDIASIMGDLQLAGVAVSSLNTEFQELRDKLADNTATGQDALDVQRELTALFNTTGIKTVGQAADKFGELAANIDQASTKARVLIEDAAMLGQVLSTLNTLDAFKRTPFQTQEDIMFDRSRREREDEENKRLGALAPIPPQKPNMEDWGAEEDRRLDAEAKRAAAESKRAATEAAKVNPSERILRTQQERIELLRLEMSVMGQSEAVRARMISQLQAEQEIIRLGNDLKASEADAIRANAAAITEYSIQLSELAKAQDEFNQRAEFFGGLGVDLFKSMAKGADGLRDSLLRVVDALTDAVLQAVLLGQGPLASLFGSKPTGGNSVGGLFGSLFGGLLGGGLGKFPAAPGGGLFDSGGYTGQGGKYQPAGVVHRGEYVFDKAATDRIGIATLEAIRAGLPGYASGGIVYDLAGKGRSQVPSSGIAEKVHGVASGIRPGIETHLFSGQEPTGMGRVGAPGRHPRGFAGDFEFYDDGRRVTDTGFFKELSMQMAAKYNANIGYSTKGYMGRGRIHIDTLPPSQFGPGQGPQWGSTAVAWSSELNRARKTGTRRSPGIDLDMLGNIPIPSFFRRENPMTSVPTTGGNVVQIDSYGTRYVTNRYGVTTGILPGGGQTAVSSRAAGGGYDVERGRGMSPAASREIEAGRGGLYHEGGIAGFPTSYRGAGQGMKSDEVTGILKRGEVIFDSMRQARQVAGGSKIVINNFTGAEVRTREERGSDGEKIDIVDIVEKVLAKSNSTPGRAGYRSIQKTFGLKPALKSR